MKKGEDPAHIEFLIVLAAIAAMITVLYIKIFIV